MNILEINTFNWGSTGNIMLAIAETARSKGHTVYTCCANSTDNKRKKALKDQILIGNRFVRKIHLYLGTYTGLNGCFSIVSTLKFLRKIKKLNIDIIHLHNLHNCYINLPLLFRYIKKNNMKVVWTLHDCWGFTGSCPCFSYVGCNKWQTHCHTCDLYTWYPQSKVDNSRYMYRLKKEWFTGVKNMTLVTPSQWLADLVKQSFLKDYPVKVINNGIDLENFRTTVSDFRVKNNIKNDFVVMGIAFSLNDRKGGKHIIETAKKMKDIKFVIVGLATKEKLPENVIVLPKTNSKEELAKIYSMADVFVNPTLEDNFPTVNLESIACGTPVITFKTGGSPESVSEDVGIVVRQGDVDGLCNAISEIRQNAKEYYSEKCVEKAKKMYNEKEKFLEYVEIYGECEK